MAKAIMILVVTIIILKIMDVAINLYIYTIISLSVREYYAISKNQRFVHTVPRITVITL